ncbi:peptidoglycan-binding protein [Streptomyces sp. NPDC001744]|uniref:peptidoglycan-binding domain-containing protein n=1 Tax=Streptomyces sp. NPDC001744 TaxID=3364606 RepID=UPI0036B829B6
MRNRAALTTAVTSATRGTAGTEHRGDRVFGKVAGPGLDGTGARGQDIELFDVTARLPKVPSRASAPAHPPRKSRHARTAAAAWRSVPLPLMLAGALSTGLGAGLTVWFSAEPDPAPPSDRSFSLPDLVTQAPVPAQDANGAPSSPEAGATRTIRHAPPPAPAATTTAAPAPTATTTAPSSASSAPALAPAPAPTAASSAPATAAPPSHRSTPSPTPTPHDRHRTPPAERTDPALGSTGPDVSDLQRRLRRLHLYLGPVDGVFTESVESALRRYQTSRYIPQENGVYGPLTRAVLTAETS